VPGHWLNADSVEPCTAGLGVRHESQPVACQNFAAICSAGVHTEKTEIYRPELVRADIRGALANGCPATKSLDGSNCMVYSAGIVASMSCNACNMLCTSLVNSCSGVSLREYIATTLSAYTGLRELGRLTRCDATCDSCRLRVDEKSGCRYIAWSVEGYSSTDSMVLDRHRVSSSGA
jgi:hypothetical protein